MILGSVALGFIAFGVVFSLVVGIRICTHSLGCTGGAHVGEGTGGGWGGSGDGGGWGGGCDGGGGDGGGGC